VRFFTRLIWQESSFHVDAVSPAGAQGVAQFMPKTAIWRGLADPFYPVQALPQSAAFLREYNRQQAIKLAIVDDAFHRVFGRQGA